MVVSGRQSQQSKTTLTLQNSTSDTISDLYINSYPTFECVRPNSPYRLYLRPASHLGFRLVVRQQASRSLGDYQSHYHQRTNQSFGYFHGWNTNSVVSMAPTRDARGDLALHNSTIFKRRAGSGIATPTPHSGVQKRKAPGKRTTKPTRLEFDSLGDVQRYHKALTIRTPSPKPRDAPTEQSATEALQESPLLESPQHDGLPMSSEAANAYRRERVLNPLQPLVFGSRNNAPRRYHAPVAPMFQQENEPPARDVTPSPAAPGNSCPPKSADNNSGQGNRETKKARELFVRLPNSNIFIPVSQYHEIQPTTQKPPSPIPSKKKNKGYVESEYESVSPFFYQIHREAENETPVKPAYVRVPKNTLVPPTAIFGHDSYHYKVVGHLFPRILAGITHFQQHYAFQDNHYQLGKLHLYPKVPKGMIVPHQNKYTSSSTTKRFDFLDQRKSIGETPTTSHFAAPIPSMPKIYFVLTLPAQPTVNNKGESVWKVEEGCTSLEEAHNKVMQLKAKFEAALWKGKGKEVENEDEKDVHGHGHGHGHPQQLWKWKIVTRPVASCAERGAMEHSN